MKNEEIAQGIVAHYLKDKENDIINELGMLEVRIGEALEAKDLEKKKAEDVLLERMRTEPIHVTFEQNKRLREALERYMGKFGDCGDCYDQAKEALKGGAK